MACCKICCGCKDCDEAEEGKCCCGGQEGVCCETGEYCCTGECVTTCADSQDALEGKCKCGTACCDSGEYCCSGVCQGEPCACTGSCDEENPCQENCLCCDGVCQECCEDGDCPGGEACCDGVCCPEGETCCGGVCCPSGEVCCDGVCQDCCSDEDCPGEGTCCAGACCPSDECCHNGACIGGCPCEECNTTKCWGGCGQAYTWQVIQPLGFDGPEGGYFLNEQDAIEWQEAVEDEAAGIASLAAGNGWACTTYSVSPYYFYPDFGESGGWSTASAVVDGWCCGVAVIDAERWFDEPCSPPCSGGDCPEGEFCCDGACVDCSTGCDCHSEGAIIGVGDTFDPADEALAIELRDSNNAALASYAAALGSNGWECVIPVESTYFVNEYGSLTVDVANLSAICCGALDEDTPLGSLFYACVPLP